MPGVRCQVHLSGGLNGRLKNSPPQITTPALNAPPLLNQEGSLRSAGMDTLTPGRETAYPTMCIKIQGLIGNSGVLP